MKSSKVNTARLAELRESRGWTLAKLSEQVSAYCSKGIGISGLSMIEQGHRQPSSAVFNALCLALTDGDELAAAVLRGELLAERRAA